jgi:hypothetical protein
VEHVIHSFAGRPHSRHILKVHLLKGDGVTDVGEIFEIAGREVVDPSNVLPLLHQRMGEGGTDKARDPGNQITSH